MKTLRWRNRTTEPQSEIKSDTVTPLTALLDRSGKEAMEIGWAQLSAAEQKQRMEAVIGSARAELVLLEQERNGIPAPDLETLRSALQELLRRRGLMAAAQSERPRTDQGEPALWHFNPHRATALATLASITALLLAVFTTWPVWRTVALSFLGALLFGLGPWKLSNPARRGAALWSGAAEWLRAHWATYRLDREINAMEEEILVAGIRCGLAQEWVKDRLALLRERCEVQRARAELAARVASGGREQERDSAIGPRLLAVRDGR